MKETLRLLEYGLGIEPSLDAVVRSHAAVYGLHSSHTAPLRLKQVALKCRIVALLEAMRPRTVLDAGASEGLLGALCRSEWGMRVFAANLLFGPAVFAREVFRQPSVVADLAWLPYPDQSFDVVVCSEVLGLVEHPAAALSELYRVTRRFLVLTIEQCAHSERERWLKLRRRRYVPAMEKNFFRLEDFHALFSESRCRASCQFATPPVLEDDAAYFGVRTAAGRVVDAADLVLQALAHQRYEAGAWGLILVVTKRGAPPPPIAPSRGEIERVLRPLLAERPYRELQRPPFPVWSESPLCCPVTHRGLAEDGDALSAGFGAPRFMLKRGVPVLAPGLEHEARVRDFERLARESGLPAAVLEHIEAVNAFDYDREQDPLYAAWVERRRQEVVSRLAQVGGEVVLFGAGPTTETLIAALPAELRAARVRVVDNDARRRGLRLAGRFLVVSPGDVDWREISLCVACSSGHEAAMRAQAIGLGLPGERILPFLDLERFAQEQGPREAASSS